MVELSLATPERLREIDQKLTELSPAEGPSGPVSGGANPPAGAIAPLNALSEAVASASVPDVPRRIAFGIGLGRPSTSSRDQPRRASAAGFQRTTLPSGSCATKATGSASSKAASGRSDIERFSILAGPGPRQNFPALDLKQ